MIDSLIPLPILIPLGTAFVLPIVSRLSRALRPITCIVAMFVTLGVLLTLADPVFRGQTLVYWMSSWTPRQGLAIGISLTIDAWGLLFALVVAVVSLVALVYSVVYMRAETGQGPYYILVMLLATALIGFSLSGDLFNQFVWLEVFSVAAFALTGFHVERRDAVEAAFKYLITNSIASFFIAIGLTLLYMQTGALNLAQVAGNFRSTPAGLVAAGLLVGGYATKAALIPWHFWLPDAHAAAPAPISALFSGALIKIGIYAVARSAFTVFPFGQGSILQVGLLTIGGLTILLGGIQMLQQKSIKRVLAFSSVAQMGYITLGLALGTPAGFAAAAFYTIHHALVKSALFLGFGSVVWRADIHDLDESGGLARQMPITCMTMCLASLSLVGMPLLSGFIGKTMIEEAAVSAGFTVLAWIAIGGSILTLAGMIRLLWRVFGPRRPLRPDRQVKEAPPLMWLPVLLLLVGSTALGLFPRAITDNLAWPAAHALYEREHYIAVVMQPQSTAPLRPADHSVEEPPLAWNWHLWGVPILVAILGSLLALTLLDVKIRARVGQPVLNSARYIARLARHWHSGLIGDYALWNAFGTAVILIALLLGTQGSR